MTLLLIRGGTRAGFGRALQAEPDLREAMALAVATGDTLRQLQTIRWLGVSVGLQGRSAEATEFYRELEARAQAADDSLHLGWAWVGLAFDHYLSGRPQPAADFYVRAAGVLERHGESAGAMWAWNGRGMVLRQAGRYADARAAFEHVLMIAESRDDAVNTATALDNLGRLDLQLGDPGLAEVRFARSASIHRAHQYHREGLVPCIDLAQARQMQGRYGAAESLLDSVLVVTRDLGLRDLEVLAAGQLADVQMSGGRPGAAAELMRSLVHGGDMPSQLADTETRLRLARAQAARDSAAAAIATLEQITSAGAVSLELRVAALLGSLLQELEQHERAIEVLGAAVIQSRDSGADVERVVLLTRLGRSLDQQGRRDDALNAYFEAVDTWEQVRSRPADPAWRELRGTVAGSLFAEVAASLVDDPARVPEAWSLIQRYRARTLQERMHGPEDRHPTVLEPLDLDDFRQSVLRPGEVWIEFVEGDRLGVIFAVTPESVTVGRIPGADDLAPRVRRLAEVVASPDIAVSDPAEAIARSLMNEWPDAVRDTVRASQRVLLCPDGTWHEFPPALADAGLTVSRLPAAAVLTALRNARPDDHPPTRILALAGSGPQDLHALPGAIAEVRWLENHFAHVQAPTRNPARGAWQNARVLHFAAHTRLDGRQPWNTSIELGPDEADLLHASSISDLDIEAHLVVLTGCTTVGSRLLGGEGMIGLTSAFLVAGAPTVVATLWPVDDAAAMQFSALFYDGLADGLPADIALAEARRACRSRPVFSAPRHWAGFVLVGEGDRTIPVQRRRPRWPLAAGLGLAALVMYVHYRHD